MLLTTAAVSAFAQPAALTPVTTRDKKIVRRWTLPGEARGLAVGAGGTLYVGLPRTQSIIAVDPVSGKIEKKVVLDSAEIAATKELVTLRTSGDGKRLFVANGSDESAVILSLPELGVLREITMEGETIRDAVPDPKGRYVYLLGRRVHVFDGEGRTSLRTLDIEEPMAIAVSSNGDMLAIVAPQDFGNTRATMVTLLDPSNFSEISREPLQTEKAIEGALFAAGDRALIALARDSIFEKAIQPRGKRTTARPRGSSTKLSSVSGPLVNSDRVCLPSGSGPQVATLAGSDDLLVYAERRCSASGSFSSTNRLVQPASLYGVDVYALVFDPSTKTLAATDRAGHLTIYNVPRAAAAK